MTEMQNQQQTGTCIETTSEFIKHFDDYIKIQEKNKEEQFKVMKYMARIVKNKPR